MKTTTKLSLKEAIKACDFNYVNENIEKLFETEPIRGEIEIKNFGKTMTAEEVLAEFEKDGCIPANATELFDWVSKNKDRFEGEYKYVIGLGSVISFGDRRSVPSAWWDDSRREASLPWFAREFDGSYWFAFSRKSSALESSESSPLTLSASASKPRKETSRQALTRIADALEVIATKLK